MTALQFVSCLSIVLPAVSIHPLPSARIFSVWLDLRVTDPPPSTFQFSDRRPTSRYQHQKEERQTDFKFSARKGQILILNKKYSPPGLQNRIIYGFVQMKCERVWNSKDYNKLDKNYPETILNPNIVVISRNRETADRKTPEFFSFFHINQNFYS